MWLAPCSVCTAGQAHIFRHRLAELQSREVKVAHTALTCVEGYRLKDRWTSSQQVLIIWTFLLYFICCCFMIFLIPILKNWKQTPHNWLQLNAATWYIWASLFINLGGENDSTGWSQYCPEAKFTSLPNGSQDGCWHPSVSSLSGELNFFLQAFLTLGWSSQVCPIFFLCNPLGSHQLATKMISCSYDSRLFVQHWSLIWLPLVNPGYQMAKMTLFFSAMSSSAWKKQGSITCNRQIKSCIWYKMKSSIPAEKLGHDCCRKLY